MSLTTRASLIVAATTLLDAGGPEGVTLREVGRRAGLSHNAPYKHFVDKQALLAAIAAGELDRYGALLAGHGDLAAAMRAYIERALRHPARFRLVYGRWTVDSPELGRGAEAAWAALLETVAAAQTAGELPAGPPHRFANLLRSVTHGAIDLALGGHLSKGDEPATPEQIVDDFVALMREQ